MTFFESLLILLLAAILLLQVSRRLAIPYPTMLAGAGVGLALIPGVPTIRIDPQTALALFIAPALLDAAFDFPAGTVKRLWRPLVALAVVAVILSALVVAGIGWAVAGLPPAAALALGAIVAPPDAAAASAVLGSVSLPRRSIAVLKGESLLNDAVALLLFEGSVDVASHGGIDLAIGTGLALAGPGGILLGLLTASLYKRVGQRVEGTLGGNLLEFVSTFLVWIVADRLHLSAVLCVVAYAMSIARSAGLRQRPRARVHSYAVWETVVFLLNVLAFLLMGMQARLIVGTMHHDRLWAAAGVAALVVVALIVTRLAWTLIYNRVSARFPSLAAPEDPASVKQSIVVGWAGMRGLVTLATAFALPADFPQRDLIVLTAFAVVLATLVFQGLTLAPLIRWLKLDKPEGDEELEEARRDLAETALRSLGGHDDDEARALRHLYERKRDAATQEEPRPALEARRSLGLDAIRAQRERLQAMRREQEIGTDTFEMLQEELDWRELALSTEEERRIEAN